MLLPLSASCLGWLVEMDMVSRLATCNLFFSGLFDPKSSLSKTAVLVATEGREATAPRREKSYTCSKIACSYLCHLLPSRAALRIDCVTNAGAAQRTPWLDLTSAGSSI